jgi:hypothetical protein
MFTLGTPQVRRAISVVIAAAIVGISGLVFDRGHEGSTPRGVVAVGALESVDFLPRVAELPEIVVTAPRYAMVERQSGA